MAELEQYIKRVHDKLQQLLKRHQALEKENTRLKEELDKLHSRVPEQHKIIEDLKQQVEILKISSGNWNEKDKKDFEKRINGYIREIDKCIAMLSK